MGPSTVAFLKDVYARAKAAGKFPMTYIYEVHEEHQGGVVDLGHAPERGMHGDRRGVSELRHRP